MVDARTVDKVSVVCGGKVLLGLLLSLMERLRVNYVSINLVFVLDFVSND